MHTITLDVFVDPNVVSTKEHDHDDQIEQRIPTAVARSSSPRGSWGREAVSSCALLAGEARRARHRRCRTRDPASSRAGAGTAAGRPGDHHYTVAGPGPGLGSCSEAGAAATTAASPEDGRASGPTASASTPGDTAPTAAAPAGVVASPRRAAAAAPGTVREAVLPAGAGDGVIEARGAPAGSARVAGCRRACVPPSRRRIRTDRSKSGTPW
jgi:hypothetical protein